MRRFFLVAFCFMLIGNFKAYAQEPMLLPVDAQPLTIKTGLGQITYDVEIAVTPEQTEAGLMFRKNFPENRAMLFKFASERVVSMWMANTPLPLDMLFLDKNGKIVAIIEHAHPYSTRIISSHVPASFTIEINAGQVAVKKIQKGQRIIHPAICGECKVGQ